MNTTQKSIVVAGLVLGAVLGMAGTFVAERNLQALCWAVDGAALVVAAVLLALGYFRKGNDVVAAGFLVFALGSSVMLAGTATTLADSAPSFAAGAALWFCGLLLVSLPRGFALWARLAGVVSAVLFAITAARSFAGARVLPTSSPLPFFAYPILVLTFAGWIWTLLRPAKAE